MSSGTSLLAIVAHARSGALDLAWRLFRESGYDAVKNDAAVLSVRGRLLKDRARSAEGAARRKLFLEAAGAYARAGDISGAAYPLINAATLSLLAGKRVQAQALARRVLSRPAEDDEQETPYYQAATHSEALLLLGDAAGARAAFAQAFARAPRAYEDHASTLRQFTLILDDLGEDKAWLDDYRPPRSLHFAGHIALAGKPDGTLHRDIARILKKERVGFGYGALAAGADILIAEALLAAGAELHLILPARTADFRAASVARFGGGWAPRFDRALKKADTVQIVESGRDALSARAIQLAAEVAMGTAAMQAEKLSTEAIQILILDKAGTVGSQRGGSGWIGAIWKRSGRRQLVLTAPRVKRIKPAQARGARGCRLVAMLRMAPPAGAPDVIAILSRLARTLDDGPAPAIAPRWTGDAVTVAYSNPAAAAKMALDVAADMPLQIAGHYAIARVLHDPFGGPDFLTGSTAALPAQMLAYTPAGAVHVTEDFAAALHAAGPPGLKTEHVGELPSDEIENPVRLFSLRR